MWEPNPFDEDEYNGVDPADVQFDESQAMAEYTRAMEQQYARMYADDMENASAMPPPGQADKGE